MLALVTTRPHNAPKLMAELIEALPSLIRPMANGRREALFTLSSTGDTVTVTLDDAVDGLAKQVQAIVDRHTPATPPAATPDPLVSITSATTLAELRAAVLAYARGHSAREA